MTPEQFKQIRATIKLSQRKLAKVMGRNYRTIQRYETGEISITPETAQCMRYLENCYNNVKKLPDMPF